MSASVPVGRHLALDIQGNARRFSLFLSPSGADLVVLAEDEDREQRLDALEMQYYRALLENDSLADHLAVPEGAIRYGRGCRDVSSVLPQDIVSLHAAIGARTVRQAWQTSDAKICVFRADLNDTTVKRINVKAASVLRAQVGDWQLVTDHPLLERVAAYRQVSLPNETGGILIGNVDSDRRIVYVADVLPSPVDSEEGKESYVRGIQGLSDRLEQIRELTQEQLDYVGEWHSHPDDSGTKLSPDDVRGLDMFATLRGADMLPAVSLIVGEAGESWYVESD